MGGTSWDRRRYGMATGSSRDSAWQQIRLQVLARDNYTCQYCGNDANEADHIIPKASGGKDVMDNLVAACRTCNASKGARLNVRTNWYNHRWVDGL